MSAITIMALEAEAKGKTLSQGGWDSKWSNFTQEDIRKFENECESKFNNSADVQKCVAEKMSSAKGGVNWGNVGSAAQQFLSGALAGRQNTGTYTPTTQTAPKNNTGLVVGVVLAVVAVGAIAYFGFIKNGK